ncbi:hypothetical protein L210DRAFT_3569572 [Boletus edulis BED1]|uniref:Uncharacterized protein n=1 Tax=Boletus edulis BED1 TaxID=1328754 RepID=A0AAD4BEE6_BOLED|nr:hypothetical protein L210DRAFT_3569572 [Boletus edulis BED1]
MPSKSADRRAALALTPFADRRGNYTVLQPLTRRLFQPRQHGESIPSSQVKSQTPKVEKQEEEKTPTGRAKKRALQPQAVKRRM